jgi:alkylhydroperoxidase family enzyme
VSWIQEISNEEARGPLRREFDKALKRAGRVWNIVRVMSLSPRTLESSMRFYIAVMMGEGPLSRGQRELLATVVSAELECHY